VVEPTLFMLVEFAIWLLIHVDDMFVLGGRGKVAKVFQMIREKMKLRETGRLDAPGQRVDFLNKRIERIEGGFRLAGNRWLVDSIVQKLGVEQSKYVGTPMVQYPSRQIMDAASMTGSAISEYRMHGIPHAPGT